MYLQGYDKSDLQNINNLYRRALVDRKVMINNQAHLVCSENNNDISMH